MHNFIRNKGTRNPLHKLRATDFHDKEMEVSGHQETKSSQGFYYPFISHETQQFSSVHILVTLLFSAKEGISSNLSCSGVCTRLAG